MAQIAKRTKRGSLIILIQGRISTERLVKDKNVIGRTSNMPDVDVMMDSPVIMRRQKRCLLRKARLYRAFLLPKRRFFSVPKRRCKIAVFPLWIDLNSHTTE